MTLIGLGHVLQSGKSTSAEALVRDLGFTEKSFAAGVKQLAFGLDCLVTGGTRTTNTQVGHGRLAWVVQGMGWEAAKSTYPEVRAILQKLGEHARIVIGENVWVDAVMNNLPDGDVVISDVRFPNEADAIKAAGGYVFRVNRPGHVAQGHISETALVDYEFDHEFDNDKAVHDLQAEVVAYVQGLKKTVPSGQS